MSAPDLHEVAFEWPHPEPNTVIVTGTFDEWSCSVPLARNSTGFAGSTKIPYGEKIKFKYVVDGRWVLHEDQATETDPNGGFVNHVYTAPPAPLKAVEPAPATEAENGKAAVTDVGAAQPEEAPTTNGHAVNGHSEAAVEDDKPVPGNAEETPEAAKDTEKDAPESKQTDAAASSGFPQLLSDIADTIAARDGTSSALGYVASGLGAVMHSVVGVDPINVQPIAIPTPAVEEGFQLPAEQGAESAAATAALPEEESAPSAGAVDSPDSDSDTAPSPIAPRVPIMIVPVLAPENSTVPRSASEFSSPIPVIGSAKSEDADAEKPTIAEPDLAAAVVAPETIVADVLASEKAEPAEAEVAEPDTAVEPAVVEPADEQSEDVAAPSKEEVEALEAAAPAPIGSTPAIIAHEIEEAPAKEVEPVVPVAETPAEEKEAESVPAHTEVVTSVPDAEVETPAEEKEAPAEKEVEDVRAVEEVDVPSAVPETDAPVAVPVVEEAEEAKAVEPAVEDTPVVQAEEKEPQVVEEPVKEPVKASEPVEEVVVAPTVPEVPAEEAPAPVPVKAEPESEVKEEVTEEAAAPPAIVAAVVPGTPSEPDAKDVAADAALAQEFLATTELKEIPAESTNAEEVAAPAVEDKKEDIAAVVVPVDVDQVVAVPTQAVSDVGVPEPSAAVAIEEETRPTEQATSDIEEHTTEEAKSAEAPAPEMKAEPTEAPKVDAVAVPAAIEEKPAATTNGSAAPTEAKKDFPVSTGAAAASNTAATESPSSSKYDSQRKKRTSFFGKLKQKIFHHDHKDKEKK